MLGEYKKKTGEDLPELNIMNLSPEQKKVLEDKIKSEKDVSIKSLLQDILDKNNDIQNLTARLQELEAMLPKPHVVEKGENHYQIAMNFLLNEKGIDKTRAMQLVERTALFEPIIPGFKVWNFYAEDEYGTFITQGNGPDLPQPDPAQNQEGTGRRQGQGHRRERTAAERYHRNGSPPQRADLAVGPAQPGKAEHADPDERPQRRRTRRCRRR